MHPRAIDRLVDLTAPERNAIYNMTPADARGRLATGDPEAVAGIEGQYALVAASGPDVYLARSISRPLRFFVAKRAEGPCLVASDRIDAIRAWLVAEGLGEQFHPSYTRMVPAHHLTRVSLLGCPDPSPVHRRTFDPPRGTLPADIEAIGRAYVGALHEEVTRWLTNRAPDGPLGVSFSGGIDSGSVFLVTYHALLRLGMSPSRLKAFTLAVDGGGADVAQARRFLDAVGLGMFLEPIEVTRSAVDWRRAVRVVEDYKPLDIQAAAMGLALGEGIKARYPGWRHLLDGDGGDENLKDYPIEDNPELTIRSVLHNPMLYQEGWGVHSLKHSATYSGGLSRGYVRTYAAAAAGGLEAFSPYTQPRVVAVAEAIPFLELTGYSHERLYELKGRVVAAGVKAVTGLEMPVYAKRRFQHGAAASFQELFPGDERAYRRELHAIYE